jgi:hypothetical protein
VAGVWYPCRNLAASTEAPAPVRGRRARESHRENGHTRAGRPGSARGCGRPDSAATRPRAARDGRTTAGCARHALFTQSGFGVTGGRGERSRTLVPGLQRSRASQSDGPDGKMPAIARGCGGRRAGAGGKHSATAGRGADRGRVLAGCRRAPRWAGSCSPSTRCRRSATISHLVDDETVIIHSHLGAAITGRAAGDGTVVCYEADDIDPVRHTCGCPKPVPPGRMLCWLPGRGPARAWARRMTGALRDGQMSDPMYTSRRLTCPVESCGWTYDASVAGSAVEQAEAADEDGFDAVEDHYRRTCPSSMRTLSHTKRSTGSPRLYGTGAGWAKLGHTRFAWPLDKRRAW